MRLTFLGAAKEVTGSCFLVETSECRFIVDCGLFQGGSEATERNRAAFGFDARTLNFALLTHAHLDHCGRLPLLPMRGFRGAIFSTRPTADLVRIMLKDSAHISAKDAEWSARHARRGRRAETIEPLYTIDDVERLMLQVSGVPYDVEVKPHASVRVRFRQAGHILGAAILELWVQDGGRERKLVFSGDLGQPGRPIVQDPAIIDNADVVVVESTYGNRLHKSMEATLDELVEVVQRTLETGHGNVLIPVFALGRTQEMLYYFYSLVKSGRLKNLHVFVDSPLAHEATNITLAHHEVLDEAAKEFVAHFRNRTLPFVCRFTQSVEESMFLNSVRSGAVIMAASGMCEGGRIRHHLRYNLNRPECAIVFAGFQVARTLGRQMVDGARNVRLFGESIPVRASVHTLGGLSAHGDQDALIGWLRGFKRKPKQCFVVHGEEATAVAFADAARRALKWTIAVPEPLAAVTC